MYCLNAVELLLWRPECTTFLSSSGWKERGADGRADTNDNDNDCKQAKRPKWIIQEANVRLATANSRE
jgi:hypothetical protein